ncbi:hypothetical protein XENOCAPTIV_009196, partial [Xenoophorus captivus]
EKEVTITMPNGETSVATVRIWNETVSNLTLMALGSSAPEILLSVIELGPGTIVGSAAFNMFVIIGICVWVIPNGQSRKIKHLRVWEALVTLLFFPVCVLLAWIADRRLLFYKYMGKRYRADKRHGIVVEMEGDLTPTKGGMEMIMDGKLPPQGMAAVPAENGAGGTQDRTADAMLNNTGAAAGARGNLPNSNSTTVNVESCRELDESRKEVIRILKELKQKYPDKELDQLVELANYYALLHQQKSRAFYRIQVTSTHLSNCKQSIIRLITSSLSFLCVLKATRMMIGAGNVLKRHAADNARRAVVTDEEEAAEDDLAVCSHISFESAHSQCMENCGVLMLAVVCQGSEQKKMSSHG